MFAGTATLCTLSWCRDSSSKVVAVLSICYNWGVNTCKSQCWTAPWSLYRLHKAPGMAMSPHKPLTIWIMSSVYQLEPCHSARAPLEVLFLGRLQQCWLVTWVEIELQIQRCPHSCDSIWLWSGVGKRRQRKELD